jgi:tetratricopeptide (TPR) repeat protein
LQRSHDNGIQIPRHGDNVVPDLGFAEEVEMLGKKVWIASLMAALLIALPQIASAEEDVASYALRDHNWSLAEQQLLAGLEKSPNNVFNQLNLAWVYAQTGRKAEAAAIYRNILKRDGDRFASTPRAGTSVTLLAERGLALLKNK